MTWTLMHVIQDQKEATEMRDGLIRSGLSAEITHAMRPDNKAVRLVWVGKEDEVAS